MLMKIWPRIIFSKFWCKNKKPGLCCHHHLLPTLSSRNLFLLSFVMAPASKGLGGKYSLPPTLCVSVVCAYLCVCVWGCRRGGMGVCVGVCVSVGGVGICQCGGVWRCGGVSKWCMYMCWCQGVGLDKVCWCGCLWVCVSVWGYGVWGCECWGSVGGD